MNSDPYIWLENLDDKRVVEWALARSEKVSRELGGLSNKLLEKILVYRRKPYIVMARLSRKAVYLLTRYYDSYIVERMDFNGKRVKLVDSRDLGGNVVIKWIDVDEEGDRLIYSYSSGSDEGIVRVIDPYKLEVLDELYGVVGGFTWLDNNEYYYVRFYRSGKTPDGVDAPAERVFLRRLDGSEEMVYGDKLSPLYMIDLDKSSDSSKALLTISYGWSKSDVYAGDLRDPSSWEKIFGGDYISIPIDYINGKYYLLVFDREGLGRVVSLDENGVVEEVVSEDEKYPLRTVYRVGDKLLTHYLVDASSRIKLYGLDGEFIEEKIFTPPGTVSSIHCVDDRCVFKYESFYIPYRLYLYSGNEYRLIDSLEISGEYSVEELWVRSFDDTPIHVFKVFRRDRAGDEALLYGYGGFSIAITPGYYDYVLPFIDDGGVFLVANIRGGGEYGEKWHRAGMRENKENVFQDFISVIKYLKNHGYRVVVMGASNGGLLTAVMLTRIPEYLDGVVIGYPVLDMLRFHKLFIGKIWTTEYGDPDNPDDHRYLLKYSPYHNIVSGKKYPPVFIYTGLYDDRVHPGHAFKFAAKLEELGINYYLRVETVSGHSGADPLVKAREYADILAFIYKVLGMNGGPEHGDRVETDR